MTAERTVILDRPLSLIARSGGKLFVAPQRAIRAHAIRRHLWLPSGRTRRTRLHVNVANSLGEPSEEICLPKISILFPPPRFAESQSFVRSTHNSPDVEQSSPTIIIVIRARIHPAKNAVDVTVNHNVTTRYVRCRAGARSAILLADWPRRNEQRSEATKGEERATRKAPKRGWVDGVRGCTEGESATMEGNGDACACFPASLSNTARAFCLLPSQVIEKEIYLPTCLPVSLVCSPGWPALQLATSISVRFTNSLGIFRNLAYISLFIINFCNFAATVYLADIWKFRVQHASSFILKIYRTLDNINEMYFRNLTWTFNIILVECKLRAMLSLKLKRTTDRRI